MGRMRADNDVIVTIINDTNEGLKVRDLHDNQIDTIPKNSTKQVMVPDNFVNFSAPNRSSAILTLLRDGDVYKITKVGGNQYLYAEKQ